MVAQATLLLFGSFFVMLLAGVPISAGIGIASIHLHGPVQHGPRDFRTDRGTALLLRH